MSHCCQIQPSRVHAGGVFSKCVTLLMDKSVYWNLHRTSWLNSFGDRWIEMSRKITCVCKFWNSAEKVSAASKKFWKLSIGTNIKNRTYRFTSRWRLATGGSGKKFQYNEASHVYLTYGNLGPPNFRRKDEETDMGITSPFTRTKRLFETLTDEVPAVAALRKTEFENLDESKQNSFHI